MEHQYQLSQKDTILKVKTILIILILAKAVLFSEGWCSLSLSVPSLLLPLSFFKGKSQIHKQAHRPVLTVRAYRLSYAGG